MSNNSSGQRLDNAKVNDDGDNEDGSKMGVGGDIETKKETKLITSPTSSSSRQLRHWDNTVERIPKKHRKRNEASVVRKFLALSEKIWDSSKGENEVASCVSPEELKRTIDQVVNPRFRGCTEQRDAVDFFLNVFIRHLHADVCLPFPYTPPLPAPSSSSSLSLSSSSSIPPSLQSTPSPITTTTTSSPSPPASPTINIKNLSPHLLPSSGLHENLPQSRRSTILKTATTTTTNTDCNDDKFENSTAAYVNRRRRRQQQQHNEEVEFLLKRGILILPNDDCRDLICDEDGRQSGDCCSSITTKSSVKNKNNNPIRRRRNAATTDRSHNDDDSSSDNNNNKKKKGYKNIYADSSSSSSSSSSSVSASAGAGAGAALLPPPPRFLPEKPPPRLPLHHHHHHLPRRSNKRRTMKEGLHRDDVRGSERRYDANDNNDNHDEEEDKKKEEGSKQPTFPTPEHMQRAANYAWKMHLAAHGRSFFTENFQGQSIRRVTCNKCLRTSIDFPAFQFLPLSPPPNQETVRFVDLFSKLPRRHSLKKWRCPVCNLLKKENKNNKRGDDKNCYNHYTAKKPTTATTILPSSSSSSSSSSSTTTTVTFAGTPSTMKGMKGSTILHNKHEILVEEGIWKLPNILMALIQRVMKTKSGKLIKNKTEVWIPRRGLDLCTLAETEGVPMTHQHHHHQQKDDEKYDNDDKKKKKITIATSTNGQDSSTFNDKNVNSNIELEIEKYDEREHQQRQQKFCEIQKIMEQVNECVAAADNAEEKTTGRATTTTRTKTASTPTSTTTTTTTTTTTATTTNTSAKGGETSQCTAPTKEDNSDGKEEDRTMKYDLYAILSHSGTPQKGHYVAHVRNMRTGDWHTFNDRKIKPCHIPSNIIKSRDVYVLFFQRQVFARAMNRLKIPGEPLTFKEWREKLKSDAPLGGGAQSGFFTSNHAIRKRPMEHEKKSF